MSSKAGEPSLTSLHEDVSKNEIYAVNLKKINKSEDGKGGLPAL